MKWCGLFHVVNPDDGWHYIDPADKSLDNGFKTFKEYCEFWGQNEHYIMVEVDDSEL